MTPTDNAVLVRLDLASVDPGELDRELTLAFQRGQTDAYRAIYARHLPRINTICRRMLGNAEDADEATQETFLKVYQSLGRFNGRYQMGPWIARIATNVCLDRLRARKRHPSDAFPLELWDDGVHDPADVTNPEDLYVRSAEGRSIVETLNGLAPNHRAAIVLRDFEGLSYSEVGSALDLSEAQVKALLHRARSAFRRAWHAASVAAFLPFRFFDRFRRVASAGKDPAAQIASTPGTMIAGSGQVAASCSTILQQCGAFSERVAAVLIAGSLAVSGSTTSASDPRVKGDPKPRFVIGTPSAHDEDRVNRKKSPVGKARVRPDESRALAAEAPPAEEPAEAEPVEEQAAEEEVPRDETASQPPAEPSPSPSASSAPPPAEPVGFASMFAWDLGLDPCPECLRSTAVRSEWMSFESARLSRLTQEMEGSIADAGTDSFGFRLATTIESDAQRHSAAMVVNTNEGVYGFTLSGTLYSSEPTPWGGTRYTYSGAFRLGARPSKSENMPESGTYVVTLSVSHESERVVSHDVTMHEAEN